MDMKSGRGGSREGAGRKSTWVSGCKQEDTKLIRVPKVIADQLLKIAHEVDAGRTIDLDTQLKNEKVTKSSSELKLIAVEECLTKWHQYSDQCSPKPNRRMDKLREMLSELELIVWEKDLSPVCESLELVTESSKPNRNTNIELATESNGLIKKDFVPAPVSVIGLVTESKPLNPARQLELLNALKGEQNEVSVLIEPPRLMPEPCSAVELSKRLKTNRSNISRYKTGKRKGGLLDWSRQLDPGGYGWEYSPQLKKYIPIRNPDSLTE